MFTTRPEIQGTFGVVTSTHWIASAVGMSMLERGGNAFDACAAAAFVLQVVEPHLNGLGGEVPAIFHSARTGRTEVLCGQGVAPAAATIAHYRSEGLDIVPGSGLLATVTPGSFDAWMMLLADHGTMRVRDVLAPAIFYARHGHPMLPRVALEIAKLGDFFRKEWPTSAATWLPNGPPQARALFSNPVLARTYEHLVKTAETGKGRKGEIKAARRAFSNGFVAAAIDKFCRTQAVMDASGRKHRGVLTGHDMAKWRASYDAPATYDYHGWTVCKTPAWGQGPVLLQALSILRGFDLASLDPNGADFVHLVTEALKLGFADREAYYGDPDFCDVPLERLLSESYAKKRRALVGPAASRELRPGAVPGFARQVAETLKLGGAVQAMNAAGIGEPTMAHLAPGVAKSRATVGGPTMGHLRSARRGDTVHIDCIDRWGNMISATPSGGWLQSSPVIPELGFALNTRAQMFWLTPGLPASLAPGKRPRTTLSPTLAKFNGAPRLVFGTPGGDQQDQWQLALFLRHVHHGMNLQEAIDQPLFHTAHFPSSFYPRAARPGHLLVEESFGKKNIAELKRRGHQVEVAPAWSAGRLTAASREGDGILRAAATPRLMQAYAIGR